jgi:ubiquinone/menaquinone biosynthesis C-methylase UbiE
MNNLVRRSINKMNNVFNEGGIKKAHTIDSVLADNIAYRVASETVLNNASKDKAPNEVFYGISDDFWFWLNTEGIRRNESIRDFLPGFPDEATQIMFTALKGDAALAEAFGFYKAIKELYKKYKGGIKASDTILDFGCGWGRVIRFFLKDFQPANTWGCDPLDGMIDLCKEQNKWSRFKVTRTEPPTPFLENEFDAIYSYSVFSHLSEEMHQNILAEIKRILKPGGIYFTTTRNRGFIESGSSNKNSSRAFPDTNQALSLYDRGIFCHHSFNDKDWPYWGETAISKKYVQDHWTKEMLYLDFIELERQNLIIIQKPLGA